MPVIRSLYETSKIFLFLLFKSRECNTIGADFARVLALKKNTWSRFFFRTQEWNLPRNQAHYHI